MIKLTSKSQLLVPFAFTLCVAPIPVTIFFLLSFIIILRVGSNEGSMQEGKPDPVH